MNRQKCVTARLATALLTVLCAAAAHAQEQFSYFELGGGVGSMDLGAKEHFDAAASARFGPPGHSSLDDSTEVWEARVGYRFNRYLAGEIGYVNLGRGEYVADYPPSSRYSVRFLSTG